jgi:hypothetical protein
LICPKNPGCFGLDFQETLYLAANWITILFLLCKDFGAYRRLECDFTGRAA